MTSEIPLTPLSQTDKSSLSPDLADPIEYRKSGLSLNHIIGCPLDCSYCVRHLFNNFEMKVPKALLTDEEAVNQLLSHRYFRENVTPIQLFNRATEAFLSSVKPHTFRVLELLDSCGINNHVLIITRWKITPADCVILNSFKNIKLTVLVTYSGIDDPRIEPVDSSIALSSLETLFENAKKYRCILYWRPIVPGLNDSDEHIAKARDAARSAHATVFTGLFYRDEIAQYYRDNGLREPYDEVARRKILPEDLERKILEGFAQSSMSELPLFRKTSCGVSYAHSSADYNGHYGIRELCDICPAVQINRCAADWRQPDLSKVHKMASELGATDKTIITERAVIVNGLDESRRYFMQHNLGYQIHDAKKPHLYKRHGRADIGWHKTIDDEDTNL